MWDEVGPITRIWEQTWAIGSRSRSGSKDRKLRDRGGDNTGDSKEKSLSWAADIMDGIICDTISLSEQL